MSKRTDRLNTHTAELRALEHVAQIRLHNAERGLADLSNAIDLPNVTNAFHAEVDAARKALSAIHEEQQAIIWELDRHTVDLPDLALILVDDPDGPRVIERRDADNTDTDETRWFNVGAPETDSPMSFDTAIGATPANPHGYGFTRLYTQDEVDDLLDTIDSVIGR
jgi:hypothetical protein